MIFPRSAWFLITLNPYFAGQLALSKPKVFSPPRKMSELWKYWPSLASDGHLEIYLLIIGLCQIFELMGQDSCKIYKNSRLASPEDNSMLFSC